MFEMSGGIMGIRCESDFLRCRWSCRDDLCRGGADGNDRRRIAEQGPGKSRADEDDADDNKDQDLSAILFERLLVHER